MRRALLDVLAFHRKFGCAVGESGPYWPDLKTEMLRRSLLREELNETIEAMNRHDITGVADGLADLIYVAIGTAISFGIRLDDVWAEVQTANMAKEGGGKREDMKILKPDGWVAPDIAGVLSRQKPLAMEEV